MEVPAKDSAHLRDWHGFTGRLELVLVAGVLNALFLIGVATCTIYLSHSETDPRIKDGPFFEVMVWISAAAIIAVGLLSFSDVWNQIKSIF